MAIANLLPLKTQYLLLTLLGVPFSALFDRYYLKNLEATGPSSLNDAGYDFIIVGAGSSGSVLANRLSEKHSVLLLEAGGYPFPLQFVPMLAPVLLRNPDIDWMDQTVPQAKTCAAMKNNVCVTSHGKGLGGSSSLNYMVYMRGNPNDYNRWANLTQDEGWSYEKLLPYFRKMENYKGKWPGPLHGTSGPLSVETNSYFPLRDEWISAGSEFGLSETDPNGYQQEGVFQYDVTTKNGKRASTFSAYLEPVLGRKTLTVEAFAHVTKIELDGENRAVGVRYVQRGKPMYAKANKEIIVSAGSLGSPKILMLSGIGPKEHLEEVGVPVKIDLPAVGQNLKDHLSIPLGPFLIDTNRDSLVNGGLDSTTIKQYLETSKGRLSVVVSPGAAAIATDFGSKEWPDVMVYLFPEALSSPGTAMLERGFETNPGVLEAFRGAHNGNDSFSFFVVPGLPKSSGFVKLASKDPFQPPIIDPQYYHDSQDIKVVVQAIKKMIKFATESQAFRKINAKLIDTKFPGCEAYDQKDDEYWKCYIRHFAFTVWHYSCTCKMGYGPQNKTSVLDSSLRVLGAKNLRVIDNSAMPMITNANTNAPAIVIGERGADIVLEDWNGKN